MWLFKTYVTACNEILARHVETWAKERNVEVEFDWATFGDREQKFVAAIEAGNPPDIAEMNYQGPMRYRPALRDVTKLAKEIADARGGLFPFADRVVQLQGQYYGVAHQGFGGGMHIRKDILAEKGLKMPKVYDPDVIEVARKCQDPSKELWGFGQTLNRSDDGNGFMQNILWDYGGSAWDKDGKPALATTYLKENMAALQFAVDTIQKHKVQPPGVMGWTDVHNNEAFMAGKLVCTNNGASLYYAMGTKKHPLFEKTQVILTPGRPRRVVRRHRRLQLGHLQGQQARRAVRGHDPLGRGREALRGVHEGLARPGRPGLQVAGREPVLEDRPELRGHEGERPARSVWPGYPGPITPAAIEVQAQYILCDMAGRVVVAGLSPEAALKEAHKRVEDIYKIRSRG